MNVSWPDLEALFNRYHPYSDFLIAFLAIVLWEIIKFARETAHTPKGRRKALAGKWQGKGVDVYTASGAAPLDFELKLILKVGSHDIKGTAYLAASSGVQEKLDLIGGFYKDRFVRLNYQNSAREQLGVIFLEFGPNSDVLSGTYAGYSPRRATVLAGKVELARP
jgi:hypothetical protein